MAFHPDTGQKIPDVPWFEEAREAKVEGHSANLSVERYKAQVREELELLGALSVNFFDGQYDWNGKTMRHGYLVTFMAPLPNGEMHPGQMKCAALPIKKPTASKKKQALKQALYLLVRRLKSMRYAFMFEPEAYIPLLPYLVTGKRGEHVETVTDMFLAQVESGAGSFALMLGDGEA